MFNQYKKMFEEHAKGVDTFALQMQSLKCFLAELDYHFVYRQDVLHIVNVCHSENNLKYMSFEDAVILHNNAIMWRTRDNFKTVGLKKHYKFSYASWCNATDSKKVEIIKLQRIRGGIKCYDNFVRLKEE